MNKLSCKNNIVCFVTVRQSNMYINLTDYQRTSGPVKSNIVGIVTVRQSNMYSHFTDYQRTSCPVKSNIVGLSLETIKQVKSPHWVPEDQWSCKRYIVGFITVRQSNMYCHLTDYQRTSGPLKKQCWFWHCGTIKLVQSPHWLPNDQWSC